MAKKSANYSTYELRVEDGGKIVILNSGELVPSAMAAIRTIAAEVGFEIDSKWNTQSAGRKLVDFLNSSVPAAAPAAKEATAAAPAPSAPAAKETPAPAPSAAKPTEKPAPVAPPKSEANNNQEELTPEEMKQLDEILKRLETLEARIAKLEKSPAKASDDGQLYVVCKLSDWFLYIKKRNADGSLVLDSSYSVDQTDKRDTVYGEILQGNYRCYEYVVIPRLLLLSNGEFVILGNVITNSNLDCTVRETKAFATQMGIEVSDKATMLSLTATIMAKYGRNGWCVGNGTLLDGEGKTYPYSVVDFTSLMNEKVGQAGLTQKLPVPVLTGKSVEEKQRIVSDYLSKLMAYPLPPKEQVIEEFKKACEEYDKKDK